MDTGASHHVTTDLDDLSIHQSNEDPDDIVIGDGTGLAIAHIISSNLNTFSFSNVLCVPSMTKTLISVSQFRNSNNTSIEFFPSFLL